MLSSVDIYLHLLCKFIAAINGIILRKFYAFYANEFEERTISRITNTKLYGLIEPFETELTSDK